MATQPNTQNLEFQKFYLRLTQINVKLKLNRELDANQQQEYEVLKYLISAFNKIKQSTSDITLDDIIKGVTGDQQTTDSVAQSVAAPELEVDTTQYMFNDTPPDSKNQTDSNHVEEFSSDDEDGDILVKTVTDNSLERYSKIRKSAWIICETDNEDSDLYESDNYSSCSSSDTDSCLNVYATDSDADDDVDNDDTNHNFWESCNSSDDNDIPLARNISELCFS